MKRLKVTPLGLREREKDMKPIYKLAPNGGGSKRRVAAIKKIIDPSLGSKSARKDGQLAELLKKIATKEDITKMVNLPGTKGLRQAVSHQVLGLLSEEVNVEDYQSLCDDVGVSRRGYIQLFKTLKACMTKIGVKNALLPRLSKVWPCRSFRNFQVSKQLGEMTHIDASIRLDELEGGGSSSKVKQVRNSFILNANNNLWIDVASVLQLMVKFYDMAVEECDGKLIIALKLDEMEMIKGEKYERVSITLMNRALNGSCGKEDFSVQSEDNIWWIGIFQVPKESYSVLKWVFDQTAIPTLISRHSAGEKLSVSWYGEYEIEWHLAADLKTIKCMYNMKHGAAKTTQSCIYCDYSAHVKAQRHVPGNFQKRSTLQCDQTLVPYRACLNPVVPISLQRVHICTLHAFLRIIDKMVYLSILFAWRKKPKSARDASLARIECVLSEMGLHGRNYKIVEDPKNKSMPSKPSMGGVKARRFLPSTQKDAKGKWECYKELLDAEDDCTDNGRASDKKTIAWKALFSVFKLMKKKTFTDQDKDCFRIAITEFTAAFIAAWGEGEVTHYMHILCAHGPWFAKEYGSLGIWNTQGMEKSHKQAKTAYFRFTSHGGGNSMSSPLQQMAQWYYRRILAKLEKRVTSSDERSLGSILRETLKKKKRRDAWHRSNGLETMRKWRLQRMRVGKKYMQQSLEVSNEV